MIEGIIEVNYNTNDALALSKVLLDNGYTVNIMPVVNELTNIAKGYTVKYSKEVSKDAPK